MGSTSLQLTRMQVAVLLALGLPPILTLDCQHQYLPFKFHPTLSYIYIYISKPWTSCHVMVWNENLSLIFSNPSTKIWLRYRVQTSFTHSSIHKFVFLFLGCLMEMSFLCPEDPRLWFHCCNISQTPGPGLGRGWFMGFVFLRFVCLGEKISSCFPDLVSLHDIWNFVHRIYKNDNGVKCQAMAKLQKHIQICHEVINQPSNMNEWNTFD